MKILILIVLITITIIRVWFVEAKHDYYVCIDTRHEYKRNWHFLGNLNELTVLLVISLLVALIIKWIAFLLIPILWLTWWITHDFAMGHYLYHDIWELGRTGFDVEVRKMFLDSGKLYFIFKVWWLLILIAIYVSL